MVKDSAPKKEKVSKAGGISKKGTGSKSGGASTRIPNCFILYYLDTYGLHRGNTANESGRRWHLMEQSEKDKYKRLYCNLRKLMQKKEHAVLEGLLNSFQDLSL